MTSTAFGSTAPPAIVSKAGIAFHVPRYWSETPRGSDAARGQFWFTAVVAVRDSKGNVSYKPEMWISNVLDSSKDPAQDLRFDTRRRGKIGNAWTRMHAGTGVALYEDLGLGALKGLWMRWDGSQKLPMLEFLPFADGSFNVQLRDGSDFRVMERGICLGIAGEAYCGKPADSYWNL